MILAFIGIASVASAQTATPNVTKRQANQQARIAQGVKSGELTPKETEHLEAREAKIQNDKKAAKADGTVTHAERAKLHREENRTSRAIYRQKHDAQHR
ncbi:MAG: hypothetical protein JST75_08475 [Bacteroidetes bacterium]|nr:hypothetical protein [Bacteroidota bacterium]